MTATTRSSIATFRAAMSGRDLSWYGTLGLVAACLGLLAATGFGP
jgi:hypothetical protein